MHKGLSRSDAILGDHPSPQWWRHFWTAPYFETLVFYFKHPWRIIGHRDPQPGNFDRKILRGLQARQQSRRIQSSSWMHWMTSNLKYKEIFFTIHYKWLFAFYHSLAEGRPQLAPVGGMGTGSWLSGAFGPLLLVNDNNRTTNWKSFKDNSPTVLTSRSRTSSRLKRRHLWGDHPDTPRSQTHHLGKLLRIIGSFLTNLKC